MEMNLIVGQKGWFCLIGRTGAVGAQGCSMTQCLWGYDVFLAGSKSSVT